MEVYILLICCSIAILMGVFIGIIIGKRKLKQEISSLEKKHHNGKEQLILELKDLQREKENLLIAYTKFQAENQFLKNKISEQSSDLEQIQTKFITEFENLAQKIFEEKSNKFVEQNQYQLKNILEPLHSKINSFEKKVEDSQKENLTLNASLKEQLNILHSQHIKISEEAHNLTKALKGESKTQGNWGELVLERVLEKSGLEKDREYFVQKSYQDQNGNRLIPDVIIHLPENKRIIIDSKVSLTAYEKYINSDDASVKETSLKEHVLSVRKHIEQLSQKNYTQIFPSESPEFILLFIPIEPAFAQALQLDNSLFIKAFEKNIVIVTPTTLLATLHTIDSLWKHQKQQNNAFEIARLAGSLYDKFEGFINDMIRLGKKIQESNSEYESAFSKLVSGKGNLITTTEKIKKLGAKTQKSLPENLINQGNLNSDDTKHVQ